MHNLLRYYNQNRIKIWGIILGVIFVLLVIQVLNNSAKQNNIKKETANENAVSYKNESETIITEEKVPKRYKDNFGKIIDTFFTYCINHEPENAYKMLSTDTKSVLYPSETSFEKLYYQEKFLGDKQYSFQAWLGMGSSYIYKVKIFENMLSTGNANSEYIEDYVTITWEDGDYKLNINSYVGRTKINRKNSNDLITVEVVYADVYMDYQIFTLRIKNNIDKEVLLDTGRQNKTVYVTDNNDNKFEAILYELSNEDLKIEANELKTIDVKFNVAFRSDMGITSINFLDSVIIEEYRQNEEIEGKSLIVESNKE